MEDKKFIEILEELAETHRPMVGPNGAPSQLKRHVEKYQDELEEAEEECFDRDGKIINLVRNDTIPLEIKKLKPREHICDDCGRVCTNIRVVEHRKNDIIHPHWRSKCRECGCFKDPFTGRFDLKGAQNISQTFRKHAENLKKTK